MEKKPSNLPYFLTAAAALGIVITAWVVRDHPAFQPVVLGAQAPSFTATDLSGNLTSLEDYGGKVILLNIWATWCPPCIEELPSMQRLYEVFEGEDFEIVAVSVDASLGRPDAAGMIGGNVAEFVQRFGLTFPILHDPDGRIQSIYRTTAVPESFLIGRDGVIYRKVTGPTEWDHEANVEFIRRLLAEEG